VWILVTRRAAPEISSQIPWVPEHLRSRLISALSPAVQGFTSFRPAFSDDDLRIVLRPSGAAIPAAEKGD